MAQEQACSSPDVCVPLRAWWPPLARLSFPQFGLYPPPLQCTVHLSEISSSPELRNVRSLASELHFCTIEDQRVYRVVNTHSTASHSSFGTTPISFPRDTMAPPTLLLLSLGFLFSILAHADVEYFSVGDLSQYTTDGVCLYGFPLRSLRKHLTPL